MAAGGGTGAGAFDGAGAFGGAGAGAVEGAASGAGARAVEGGGEGAGGRGGAAVRCPGGVTTEGRSGLGPIDWRRGGVGTATGGIGADSSTPTAG